MTDELRPGLTPEQRIERLRANLEGSVWGLRQLGWTMDDVLVAVHQANSEWDPSPQPAFTTRDPDARPEPTVPVSYPRDESDA